MMERATGKGPLALYEQLEQHSEQMVDAARTQDWQQLEALEHACGVLIAQLERALNGQSLSRTQQQAKGRIMLRILTNDARVRQLAGCAAGAALMWPETVSRTVH